MMNKKVLGIFGLSAVALVGGTFAYFTQTAQIDNPFNTAKYSMVVTEDFDPSKADKWQPGAEVEKKVNVHNTGDRGVVVKVEFEDHWKRDGETDEFKTVTGADATITKQDSPTDGLTKDDQSVVDKTLDTTNWTKIGGAYYYNTVLAGGDDTDDLLSKVKLMSDVDMGNLQKVLYYTTADDAPALTDEMTGWTQSKVLGENEQVVPDKTWKHTAVVTKAADGQLGYSNAHYTLTIKITTVQATDVAVKKEFTEDVVNQMTGWKLDTEAVSTPAQGDGN